MKAGPVSRAAFATPFPLCTHKLNVGFHLPLSVEEGTGSCVRSTDIGYHAPALPPCNNNHVCPVHLLSKILPAGPDVVFR